MFRIINIVLGLVLMFSLQSGFAQAVNKNLTGQSFSGEIVVNAAPDQVYRALTDVGQLTEIMGYEYLDGAKKFNREGDGVRVKVWGDASRFALVRANPGKELRFNLDPANGSYICNCRWQLSKAGKGTKVRFEERYTESSPQSPADLAAQVKDTNQMFRRLKAKIEK